MEDWGMGISGCSLRTEPWGNSQKRTDSFFCYYLLELVHRSSVGHQSQVVMGCVLRAAAAKANMLPLHTSSFLRKIELPCWSLVAFLVSGEDCVYQPRDVCLIRSLPRRLL